MFLSKLKENLHAVLDQRSIKMIEDVGEMTLRVKPADLISVSKILRDHPDLHFDVFIDLCGVDYQDYGDGAWDGPRFASVIHLLSLEKNWRTRIETFADDDFPVIPTVVDVWPAANWYERESFDLYGIIYEGHPDLRRILTDYGFVGHPFRKDFPLSGNVEMRYDPEQGRVIYQPVTIEERVLVPRVIRQESYSG